MRGVRADRKVLADGRHYPVGPVSFVVLVTEALGDEPKRVGTGRESKFS